LDEPHHGEDQETNGKSREDAGGDGRSTRPEASPTARTPGHGFKNPNFNSVAFPVGDATYFTNACAVAALTDALTTATG
jgi:hypothetical protein